MLLVVWFSLFGCAPSSHAIKAENITPETIAIEKKQPGAVVLKVDGGWDTMILGLQVMPNAAVMDALKATVAKAGLFEKLSADGKGDYLLEACIFDINQPLLGGGEATVLVEMAWMLYRGDGSELIWRETIETSHTAEKDAAFGLYQRVNLAAEAATKDNIKTALERISKLAL
jgi:hypothetical protein